MCDAFRDTGTTVISAIVNVSPAPINKRRSDWQL